MLISTLLLFYYDILLYTIVSHVVGYGQIGTRYVRACYIMIDNTKD